LRGQIDAIDRRRGATLEPRPDPSGATGRSKHRVHYNSASVIFRFFFFCSPFTLGVRSPTDALPQLRDGQKKPDEVPGPATVILSSQAQPETRKGNRGGEKRIAACAGPGDDLMTENRAFDGIRSLFRDVKAALGVGRPMVRRPRRLPNLTLEALERRDQPSVYTQAINVDEAHRIQLPVSGIRAQDLVTIHVSLTSNDGPEPGENEPVVVNTSTTGPLVFPYGTHDYSYRARADPQQQHLRLTFSAAFRREAPDLAVERGEVADRQIGAGFFQP
jgi:hypothetical protein